MRKHSLVITSWLLAAVALFLLTVTVRALVYKEGGGGSCKNPICMTWQEAQGNGKGQKLESVELGGSDEARGTDKIHGVYITAGQYYLSMVDLEIPGRGFPYRFERKYKSQVNYDGPLGFGWDYNYNMRLNASGSNMYVLNGLARKDLYTYNVDGSYATPAGVYNVLKKNANGTFTLREADGTKYNFTTFDTASNRAFLSSIVDRNQNQMRFQYDSQKRLSIVYDTLNRPIQYLYNSSNHLDHLTDFTGRTVRFQYDSENNLVGVTTPVVNGTPNGNDFPNGKTTAYFYTTGFGTSALNHNLLTITHPNETVLNPDGPPVLVNTYGTDTSKPYEFDKILTQTYGGLNAASSNRGLPAAGGTLNYFYQELNAGADPNNLTLARNRTTIVDRDGNVSTYEQNIQGANISYKEYTGRVNPALNRTTLATLIPSANASFPPIPKLRPEDPAFYETTSAYDVYGNLVQTTDPEGSRVDYVYDVPNPNIFQRLNLLQVTKHAGPRGGDGSGSAISDMVTKFVYEPLFNQVQMVSEPRGLDPAFTPPINPTDTGIVGIDFDGDGTITALEKRRTRYTSVNTFDYQETTASQILTFATAEGIQLSFPQAQALSVGNTVTTDVNGDGVTNQQQGNIIRVQQPPVQLTTGGNQSIVSLSRYNSRGQILTKIDPDQSIDTYAYYPESNPPGSGGVPADADTIAELGGYLGLVTRDTTATDNTDNVALNITTKYRYDPVGNTISMVDGRGVRTDYFVNELNQVVRTTRAANVAASPETGLTAYGYTTTKYYDDNSNLTQIDVQNKDGNIDSTTNPALTTSFAYDILNNKIESTAEVSLTKTVTAKFRYDANQNLVRSIQPLNNYDDSTYDERDMVFTTTLGADTPPLPQLLARVMTRTVTPWLSAMLKTLMELAVWKKRTTPTTVLTAWSKRLTRLAMSP